MCLLMVTDVSWAACSTVPCSSVWSRRQQFWKQSSNRTHCSLSITPQSCLFPLCWKVKQTLQPLTVWLPESGQPWKTGYRLISRSKWVTHWLRLFLLVVHVSKDTSSERQLGQWKGVKTCTCVLYITDTFLMASHIQILFSLWHLYTCYFFKILSYSLIGCIFYDTTTRAVIWFIFMI